MEKVGIYTKITPEDEIYPEQLRKYKDRPKQLYCLGNLEIFKKRMVAVVGSRRTSQYGRWVARNISEKLARADVAVVSGMAKGIDTAAHSGALNSEGTGKTIAVLGTGIDKCYPAENWSLKDHIAHEGLVISEYEPGVEGAAWRFPMRNRIISALSEMIVVCEAGVGSGALNTAQQGQDMNKKIAAVPGNINSAYCMGSNKLLQDGAMPIVVMDDVLQYIGINGTIEFKNIELSDSEKEVLNHIQGRGEVPIEKLCVEMGKRPPEINGIITILEMKGVVCTSLGKVFVAK